MSRNKEDKEKKKGCLHVIGGFFKGLGITVLLLIVAAIGLGIYLMRVMKDDPVKVRSLQEYRQAQVECDPGRISFSQDGTMTQTYSDDEILRLFSLFIGDEWPDIDEYVSKVPGLSLTGIAVEKDEDGTVLCAEADFRGHRLVARSGLDIRTDRGEARISLVPEWFSIGKIKIPTRLIDSVFGTRIRTSDIGFDYDPLVLQKISKVEKTEKGFVISGPMSTALLDSHTLQDFRVRLMRFTQSGVELAAPAIDTEGDDPVERYATLLPHITEDPEKFIEFLRQLFPMCSHDYVDRFFLKDYGIAKLWFPEPDTQSYDKRREELLEEYYRNQNYMKTICDQTSRSFYTGSLIIRDSGAVYRGRKFDPYVFYGSQYGRYKEFFDAGSGRFCIVRRDQVARQAAGLLMIGADGWGYLVEFYTAVEYNMYPLEEELFTAYMQAEKTPEIILSELQITP